MEKVAFSRLHVFKYSPRRGTPAASFSGQISPAVKEARSRKMIRLGEKLAKLYAQKFLGQTLDVLVEEKVAEHTWEEAVPIISKSDLTLMRHRVVRLSPFI